MKKIQLFAVLTALLLSSSCASIKQNQWLKAHNTQLTRLASSNATGEEKLDGLLTDFVGFLKEDLKFVNPVKGVKYVKKYHDQNLSSIENIIKDTEKWQSSMNLLDKGSFGLRVIQKPYIKDLVELAPKFRKKYKQYQFVANMTGKVTGGLTKVAGKNIGL